MIHIVIHKASALSRAEGLHEAAAKPELALDDHSGLQWLRHHGVIGHEVERAAGGADQRPGEVLPRFGVFAPLGLLHLAGEEGAGGRAEIFGFGVEKHDLAAAISANEKAAREEGPRRELHLLI